MGKFKTPLEGIPTEEPSGQPIDLHKTSDIRIVIREVGMLTERIDNLVRTVEKLGSGFEKALDKQSADLKERLADVKTDIKATDGKVVLIENKVSFVKGAMWVLGGLFVLVIAAFRFIPMNGNSDTNLPQEMTRPASIDATTAPAAAKVEPRR